MLQKVVEAAWCAGLTATQPQTPCQDALYFAPLEAGSLTAHLGLFVIQSSALAV